ncbi:hypothetical protein HPB51_029437 [Rhipicephalus microplus]|uniref:Uncharacterized protein n=1 Tax=Rhipicephalus microplus TaxID=6941 RepID=A0A9J6CU93_RHIMP|nr:hypothetical protein HPB51_029437 [Rhipicephalus microplus]
MRLHARRRVVASAFQAAVKKRLIASSRLSHLPRDHHRVIVRPRNGQDMRTVSQIKFAKSLAVAAALSEEEVTEDVVCLNMMQKIAVVSTPAERNARVYPKITAITLGTASFAVSAYQAAPDDTCKGIIRGVARTSVKNNFIHLLYTQATRLHSK